MSRAVRTSAVLIGATVVVGGLVVVEQLRHAPRPCVNCYGTGWDTGNSVGSKCEPCDGTGWVER